MIADFENVLKFFSPGNNGAESPDTKATVIYARGLNNLGNTCFLNSVLQAVSSCPSFVTYVHNVKLLDKSSGKFSNHLHKCFMELRNSQNVTSPYNPRNILRLLAKFNPNFDGNDEQDALEVFESLLGCVKAESMEHATKLKSESRNKIANLSNSLVPIQLFPRDGSGLTVNTNANLLDCPFEGWSCSHLECQACVKLEGDRAARWLPTRHQVFSTLPLSIATDVSDHGQMGGAKVPPTTGSLPAGSSSSNLGALLPGGRPIGVTHDRDLPLSRPAAGASSSHSFEQIKVRRSAPTIYHCIQEFFQSENLSQISCSACSTVATQLAVARKISVSAKSRDRKAALAVDGDDGDSGDQILPGIHDQLKSMHVVGERDAHIGDFDQGFFIHPLNHRKEAILASVASPRCSATERAESDIEMLLLSLRQPRFSDAVKHTSLSRLPQLLCLYLCRRTYDGIKGRMKKIVQYVSFPILLNMDQYQAADGVSRPRAVPSSLENVADTAHTGTSITGMMKRGLKEKMCSSGSNYQLKAVVEHKGTAETGHYVSYCLINDKPQRCWEYFSDELHHPVSEEVVLAAQATMLFYEKVSA